jgi:hypothetical protein
MSWQFPPAEGREVRGLTTDRLFLVLSLTHIKGLSVVGFTHATQTLETSSGGVPRPDRLAVGREFDIFRLRTITT